MDKSERAALRALAEKASPGPWAQHPLSPGAVRPTYKTWKSMMARCHKPGSSSYWRYGARGILVCERWHEFGNFLADMGPRPEGCSIDRIDNGRGYEPANCRWATPLQQQNNRTNNVRFEAFGKSLTLAEWSREVGLCQSVLRDRIVNLGWGAEKALTTKDGREAPVRNRRTHCFRGHPLTDENTIYSTTRPGRRTCRICKSASNRANYERSKEAGVPQ